MSNVHLVVPDLFLPQPVAAATCGGLALPALGTLLARAETGALPQESLEAWLCSAFGVTGQAVAALTLRADGMQPGAYYWLRADPVHVSMQREQLILHTGIQPDAEEAAQLCASLNEHFAADGLRFFAPHPQRWYLRLDEAPDMVTVALSQVEGRNAYEYLPQGADALRWHALFNEMQMLLYGHPVNDAREARGEPSANSVWLWGGGHAAAKLARPCARMLTDGQLAAAFARAAGIPCGPLPEEAAQWNGEGDVLVIWEGLRGAYRRGDLHAWRAEAQRLEECCIRPLLGALRAGRIAEITLDVLRDGAPRRFVLTRGAAWKLWRRPVPFPDA